jgi:hypothetical protein
MKQRLLFPALIVALMPPCSGQKAITWESGTVLSQQIGSGTAGAYATPIGRGAIAAPLYQRTNDVVIATPTFTYQWREKPGRKLIVLAVNSTVQFYRDGNWFVVLDSEHSKHQFTLLGMTATAPPVASQVPPLSAATTTGKMLNCRVWQTLSPDSKLAWTVGAVEGFYYGSGEDHDKTAWYKGSAKLLYPERSAGLDALCGNPENAIVPIVWAMRIVSMKGQGDSPSSIADAEAELRRNAAKLAADDAK